MVIDAATTHDLPAVHALLTCPASAVVTGKRIPRDT